MSDELRTHAEILMDLRERRSIGHEDGNDTGFEPETSGYYATRFAELLSIFMPEEESATALAHH